jgi:hypothetical protein
VVIKTAWWRVIRLRLNVAAAATGSFSHFPFTIDV